ncbi:hypothetical protein CHCC20441_2121 [Bacillus licheniformis]|uniref:Uncharacterized protein n=1 Tax=Bacillus licheniformis TaxID=1402 RepID=A0A8B5YGB6_BACLI|nr:hypothetical protein B4092_3845 [Bacillus licheniformis]TWN10735.1 hypothetical protein CHCC14564_3287 [Bacillus licheniformis LMG 17339]KYC80322.1 hypothetical protein B4090_3659 [Bacillus licheniformis]KYC84611.1 hypothetical protein B4091_3941 [Bacillus licheniformis]KYC98296.1 hypothetical protein B4164_3332 [Bacillus licheniformis]
MSLYIKRSKDEFQPFFAHQYVPPNGMSAAQKAPATRCQRFLKT